MITEAALGDAYGAGFEFASREKIDRLNTLERYEHHPRFTSIYKRYTDDTQMALAITECLLSDTLWTPLNLADAFIRVFKRDPREGYGWKFNKVLTEASTGAELLTRVETESKRNGAVMRAYPIGVLPDPQQVLTYAGLQASITHNTTEAITSAQAIALAIHYVYYRLGPLQALPEYLKKMQGIQWNTDRTGEVQIDAVQSVEAVLTLLTRSPRSLKKLLIDSVSIGGDVDTVASLALAIASLVEDVENDLPQWLYADLENGDYGLDYIQRIDQTLFARYPRPL